jgi:hypothetical protein
MPIKLLRTAQTFSHVLLDNIAKVSTFAANGQRDIRKQKEGSPAGEPSYYFHIQDVHYFKPASSTAERMM